MIENQAGNPFPILEGKQQESSRLRFRSRWVEDVFGQRAWGNGEEIGAGDFFGLAASPHRLIIFFVLLGSALLILFGRVSFLVAKSDSFRALSEGNRLRTVSVAAPRGVFYDRFGTQLSDNLSDLELAVTPVDFPKDEPMRSEALSRIAAIMGADAALYRAALDEFGTRSYAPVTLAGSITREQAIQLSILDAEIPGILIDSAPLREYGFAGSVSSLSHLLGYLGKVTKKDLEKNRTYLPTDTVGRTGLESMYEAALRGVPGSQQVEVDALGNEVRVVAKHDPERGQDIHLALDLPLQKKAEESLQNALTKNHLKRGVVLVEDVRTGEMLSMVSLPSYSNARFSHGISTEEYRKLIQDPDQPLFPRAISGVYPSGSTVKPVVAAAALAEGVINQNTSVVSTGGIQYSRWFFPDWKAGGHGITNVRKALAESVNTFFYMVGGGFQDFKGLGIDRLDKYFDKFGLGKQLGIDLPGEGTGLVPTPAWKEEVKDEPWFIGDTYHVSIGQGDLSVTPLQVVSWTAAIANGGKLLSPHLKQGGAEVIADRLVDDSVLKTVRAGLRQTVTGGSARLLGSLPIAVAGKTGTAQWNIHKNNHAWFAGFAPYEDPQIAITVLLEEGIEGSSTAVPVANEILYWWAQNRYKQ